MDNAEIDRRFEVLRKILCNMKYSVNLMPFKEVFEQAKQCAEPDADVAEAIEGLATLSVVSPQWWGLAEKAINVIKRLSALRQYRKPTDDIQDFGLHSSSMDHNIVIDNPEDAERMVDAMEQDTTDEAVLDFDVHIKRTENEEKQFKKETAIAATLYMIENGVAHNDILAAIESYLKGR